jgi:penicillin-binding protein 2
VFDIFLDHVKKLLKSRLFPITIIYLVLFFIIINQLFVLQIVKGPTIVEEDELRKTQPREIKSTRGNIYDSKGKVLAHDVLTYSVMMEDSTKIESNEQRNEIIYKMIQIIEENGDTLDTDFYLALNEEGELEFTVEGAALTRFKKNVYSFVLDENQKLTEKQEKATPQEVYDFLCNGTGNAYTRMFGISDQYTTEEALKIMSVRYALFLNFPKYNLITVASNVSDTTIAAVEENSADLVGVDVQQQTHRVYEDSLYFAHIIGYTGKISAEELEEYNADGSEYYNSTDIVGKSGLEKEFEEVLGGKKGSELVSTTSAGKVIDVIDHTDPVAGNDLYLTIDSDLQRSVYHLLEKELSLILLRNITSELDYGSKGESASEILIPIYEVYNALINNNIIDIEHFDDKDATALEKSTYQKFQTSMEDVFEQLDTLLAMNNTTPNNQAGDMEQYLDYFYTILSKNDILLTDQIPIDDPVLLNYNKDKTSLSKFLQTALANNWIDLSKLGVGDEYFSAEELYQKLINYTKDILINDDNFNKMIYRNLVFSYKLSGTEICLLLFDQDVLKYNEDEINSLRNGGVSAYNFITEKIKDLEITPAMLALEPCSGSVVITDITGNVKAMVTYPSYDNNMFANKVDADYYAKVYADKSQPILNRAANVKTAPGSTFKMVTSFAALEEGVTTPDKEILDLGLFEKSDPPAKCHIYPGSHGSVNIVDALKVSCNYYFYEMGWLLSIDSSNKFNQQLGLSRLKKYATLFGLNEPAGVEIHESAPQISDSDSIRSSIGQGSNNYTPLQLSRYVTTLANHGTCYNLTLLDKVEDKDGKVIKDNSATVNHDLTDFKESTWNSVLEGMYSVANVYGGSVYSTFNNFGVTVAGKTGTSQISTTHPNNALFISFAPYNDPEISVTTVIPNGYTSHNAAELSKAIYSLYFNLDKEENLLNSDTTASDTNIDAYLE